MIYSRKAFTLIELALVLIVIGLLTGGSAKLFSSLSKKTKVIETKDSLNAMSQTLQGFVLNYHRLPSPAEWEGLFLHQDDSWGKKISYSVDPLLSEAGSLCHLKQSALSLVLEGKEEKNIAFALISSGANRNLQTRIEDTLIEVAAVGALKDFNSIDREQLQPYDDHYLSFSLSRLQLQSNCSKEYVSILNNELPKAYYSKRYHASLFGQGGGTLDGDYMWCIQKKSDEDLKRLDVVTKPILAHCSEAVSSWTKSKEIELVSKGIALIDKSNERFDFKIADRFGNIGQKSLILNVEH